MAEACNKGNLLKLEEAILISEKTKTIACHLGVLNKLLEGGRQAESKKMLKEVAVCIIDFIDNYSNSVLIDYYKYAYQRADALYQLKFSYRGC